MTNQSTWRFMHAAKLAVMLVTLLAVLTTAAACGEKPVVEKAGSQPDVSAGSSGNTDADAGMGAVDDAAANIDESVDAAVDSTTPPVDVKPQKTRKVVIGIVAKSQSNAVFQVAHTGARAAAKILGDEYGVDIELLIETPTDEDAQKQAEAIEMLSTRGADGIAVSASDASILRAAIQKAVERGSVVVCFDSDVPDSGRLAYYGTDDIDAGQRVMAELATVMDGQGVVAILAGNQSAPNLQKRKEGVLMEIEKHEGMSMLSDGVFYHEETPERAAEAVNVAQSTSPQITGWAMIGGWPLFTNNALRWEPGAVKVVSIDALPAMLDYLDSGHVQVLLAQDCYGWGYESVRLILDKVVRDTSPENERIIAPLERVTQDKVEAYRAKFKQWVDG